jgi:hypothetical protein
MKKFLFIPLIFSLVLAYGQEEKDPTVQFAETITAHDLETHLTFLSHDMLEGRNTGERGQHLAGLYIETQFRRLGLASPEKADNYHQTFRMARSKVNSMEMSFGKGTFEYKKDFFTFGAHGLPETLEGNFVFGGYGINSEEYNNLEGLDVKDKIAVVFAGSPKEESGNMRQKIRGWFDRAKGFEAEGASAMMMILPQSAYSRMVPYASRSSLVTVSGDSKKFPVFYLSEEMGAALFATAKAKPESLKDQLAVSATPPTLEFKKMKFSYAADVENNDVNSSNVAGYLEGTDKKDELVIITAHYDHVGTRKGEVYNGADDDGSGTSTVLELAEAFSQAAANGYRPLRSMLFMTVSGEEIGLVGSEFYVDNPLYPLENTVADLNIDMIGRTDPDYEESEHSDNYVYVIGADKLSSDLHALHEAVNEKYANVHLDYRYNDENDPNRFYYRSDHYNFAKKNIPIIFYFTGTHVDYHKPTDTVEKIEFDKMTKIARLVFHTAWELANGEERPKVDKAQGK